MWFAATLSPTGGSAELIRRLHRRQVQVIISRHVVTEVTRNLQKKGDATALRTFFDLIAAVQPGTAEPTKRAIEEAWKVINEKDARILASAKTATCDVLVTLDRRHFLQPKVAAFAAPMQIVLPGDLLR